MKHPDAQRPGALGRLSAALGWFAGRTWFGPAVLGVLFVAALGVMLWGMQRTSLSAARSDLSAGAATARACVHQNLDASREYLCALAKELSGGGVHEGVFRSRLAQYQAEHPELVSVVFVDANAVARWSVPSQGDPAAVGLPLACPLSQEGYRQAAATGRWVYSPPHVSIQGEPAFDLNVPVLHGGRFVGSLVGVYSCQRVLRHVLHRDLIQKHRISMLDADGHVLVPLPAVAEVDRRLSATVDVDPPGQGLRMRLEPYGSGFWSAGTILLAMLYAGLVAGMSGGMWSLKRQIARRLSAERSLREARDELADRVRERTGELEQANQSLQHEIVERRRAEQSARQRLEELAHVARVSTLGELAAGLAHELNQPLGAIATFAEGGVRIMDAGQNGCEQVREALTEIEGQARRAGRIIHRLRAFVTKSEPQKRPADLRRLVEEVVDLIAQDIRQEQVQLRIEIPADLPAVQADSVQVQQVLLNLLRNAIEAMQQTPPPGPRELTVSARIRTDGLCQVSVADTGPGCPAETLDRLCEAFYTTKPQGIGMGLSISRSIVEAHGGKLWFQPSPAGGLVVHFLLTTAEGAANEPDRNA